MGAIYGKYFEEYIEEALENIRGEEVFKMLTDEIQEGLNSLNVDLFIKDIAKFNKILMENSKTIKQASVVWESFTHFVEGTDPEQEFTSFERVSQKALAEVAGYAAKMTELGYGLYGEMAELVASGTATESKMKDLSDKIKKFEAERYKEVFESLLEGVDVGDLGDLAPALTGIDLLVAGINGQFDAYMELMKEYGIDLEKITDLEAKRAEVIEREVAALKESTQADIDATVDQLFGKISPLEGTVMEVAKVFEGLYKAMEDILGIKDQSKLISQYSEEKADLEKEMKDAKDLLEGLFESITEGIKDGTMDTGPAIEYFEGELDKMLKAFGTGGIFDDIIKEMGLTTDGFTETLKSFFPDTRHEEWGYMISSPLAGIRDKLIQSLTDFGDSLTDVTTVEQMGAGLTNILNVSSEFREAIEEQIDRWRDPMDPGAYDDMPELGAALDFLDAIDQAILGFQERLDELGEGATDDTIQKLKDIIASLTGGDISEAGMKDALAYLQAQLASLDENSTDAADRIAWLTEQIAALK